MGIVDLLAAMSALMHDLGKAPMGFQGVLRGTPLGANSIRHEWISLRLLEAFVGNDDDEGWLQRLAALPKDSESQWLDGLRRDGCDINPDSPFEHLPPLAAAIGWLIVTHHRLPKKPDQAWGVYVSPHEIAAIPDLIEASWFTQARGLDSSTDTMKHWQFDQGLPTCSEAWCQRVREAARQLLGWLAKANGSLLESPYILHLSRLSLMLGDHYYSSLTTREQRACGQEGFPLYANTVSGPGSALNQPLDEHLIGVEAHAREVAEALPGLRLGLPRLKEHVGFESDTQDERFAWQNRAFGLARAIRADTRERGFFGVNMASTGCGKTIANGRIMYGLADEEAGARFSIALGLRSLTNQTGQSYRERLNLSSGALAIRVGGSDSQALYEHYAQTAHDSGSESRQSLLEEDGHVQYGGQAGTQALSRKLAGERGARALLDAPILVCTVDHLVPATESLRGGRQIAPMLRLLSGDLVLDEIDDFASDDLPALIRLVTWAGMLGARVLLSSATLPPAFGRGFFEAYCAGRREYERHQKNNSATGGVATAWFDEYGVMHEQCANGDEFEKAHGMFVEARAAKLAQQPARRKAEIQPISDIKKRQGEGEFYEALAERLIGYIKTLHGQHHGVDPYTGKHVSLGLVRMAHIGPLVNLARALFRREAPQDIRIHVCVYHSRHPLLVRSEIEGRLDALLDRREPDLVWDTGVMRRELDHRREADQIFLVLGSPVAEVGRDHDYDWAIVEPSSMRSIIQIAGRVRRHREGECQTSNMVLLDTNIRHLMYASEPAYTRPGYEGRGRWRLDTHDLNRLLRDEEYAVINAVPRIRPKDALSPRTRLADLEHVRLREELVPGGQQCGAQRRGRRRSAPHVGAYTWYQSPAVQLTGQMTQASPFRRPSAADETLVLIPDDDTGRPIIHRLYQGAKGRVGDVYQPVEHLIERLTLDTNPNGRIEPWLSIDYCQALSAASNAAGMRVADAAKRLGFVRVPHRDQGWLYHPYLGFL